MTPLSIQIREEDEAACPFGTAVVERRKLDNWARKVEELERDARSNGRWSIFACAVIGLLFAVAVCQRAAYYPKCGEVTLPVMSLDPTVIRAAREAAVEI